MNDRDKVEQEEVEREQLWVGAYVAAYAITLFKYPDLEPQDIDRPARRHADWVTTTIADRTAAMLKKEKQP